MSALAVRLAMGRVGMTSAVLTSGTFEGFIKGADKALVDFYDRTGAESFEGLKP